MSRTQIAFKITSNTRNMLGPAKHSWQQTVSGMFDLNIARSEGLHIYIMPLARMAARTHIANKPNALEKVLGLDVATTW